MNRKFNYDLTKLYNGLDSLGIEYNDNKINQLITFYEMVVEKNKVMNLTGITEFDEFVYKHFLDSLILEKAFPQIKNNISVIDVGTGAGFPGIPLAIIYDNAEFTLIDSLNKRVNFLNEVITALSIENVNAVAGRAEELGKNSSYREQYDLCVTRAVAEINLLSEYTLPFVKVGGKCIPYKSLQINDEIENGSKAISILGGEIDRVVEIDINGTDLYRNLLLINKIESTPSKYPRRPGIPKKKPL
ncbi:MAG: 16S rRNA (guanine(527)-N(7))-methyltransferase RsmG [Lachnospiraceae bacterium]|nr:16S rRNA (guanine(527)-N(7))-methyltransferase RsmG [Lachnospiraceae bacterium]